MKICKQGVDLLRDPMLTSCLRCELFCKVHATQVKMKAPYDTKLTRSGCSPFFPDLPDHWYEICEIPVPVPKDTARKKKNQTHRAHAPTRKMLFVFAKKVKVNATGSASRNQNKVKVKVPKSPVVNGVNAHGFAESTGEFKDYFVERLLGKLTIKEEKPVACSFPL